MALKQVFLSPVHSDQRTEQINTSTGLVDKQAIETWVVVFDATDNPTKEQAETANLGAGKAVPLRGSVYANDSSMICTRVQPIRRKENRGVFDIQVEYRNNVFQAPTVPPTGTGKQNIQISVRPIDTEQDVYFDKDDNPYDNSAGELIPGRKLIISDEEIQIRFQVSTLNLAAYDACKNHVNSDTIIMHAQGYNRTFPPRTLYFKAPSYDLIINGQPPYLWSVVFSLWYKQDKFHDSIVDRGFYMLDSDNKRVLIRDKSGVPLNTPTLLDGDGNVLGLGDDVVFLDFDVEPQIEFTDLLLGV